MAGYGFRPINVNGGGYQTGGSIEYPMTVSTVKIFYGDVVEFELTTGKIIHQNDATGESPTNGAGLITLGVFVGCRYVDSNGLQQYSNYYPGGNNETEAFCSVITDPNQLYEIDGDGSTTVWSDAFVGQNTIISGFASSSGNTATGLSAIRLDLNSVADTVSLACRIIGKSPDPDNQAATGTVALPLNVIVRFNFGVTNATNGIGSTA